MEEYELGVVRITASSREHKKDKTKAKKKYASKSVIYLNIRLAIKSKM